MPSVTDTQTLAESNDAMLSVISREEPFLVCRMSHAVTMMSIFYDMRGQIHPQLARTSSTHDGIYARNREDLELYARFYMKAIENMSLFACFSTLYTDTQNYAIEKYAVAHDRILHNRVLEPFYQIAEDPAAAGRVWTWALRGKRVLIVSPFVDTFRQQREAGFRFFGKERAEEDVWAPDQEFVYYKAYNCLYNNHPHGSWFETFQAMCRDIRELDFDVALLSCGGYGLPLCNFIYEKLGKSAVYMGGSLQLLFGVYGNRWANHGVVGPLIKAPGSGWVRPSDAERPANYQRVEGGCYW